jgi:hypothetical protein
MILDVFSVQPDEAPVALGRFRSTARLSMTAGQSWKSRRPHDARIRSTLRRPRIRCLRPISRSIPPRQRRLLAFARSSAPCKGAWRLTLRQTDAAIERWPIGPTGEARCTAFKVRSAPTLPVPPGCGIRFDTIVMPERMPTGVGAGSDKSEPRSDDFRRRVLDRRGRVDNWWPQCGQV